ncbi:MAG: cation diffusion facilitator family transporter [Eubacteriales bacterium]
MISILSKFFIKNHHDYSDAAVRGAYGVLCGVTGIVLNVILFAFKLFAGLVSGSVAVTADAFNNLSDAGSSVITLIGFRLAAQKPDRDHPFGHGRYEYISGLIVALIIMLMGIELAKESFDKILHPQAVELSAVTFLVLAVSVAVKLYMSLYNRAIGKKINSPAMKATAADSISDVVSTTVVMLAMAVTYFTNWQIDGYCGLAVALFILYAGFGAARDTINPLLGQPPTKEFVEEIRNIVMSYPQVKGIHDLVVHDYGPGRIMVSLHAEVDESANLLETHDVIDNIEKYITEKMGCSAVIHMDPIAVEDGAVVDLKKKLTAFVKSSLAPEASLHDFRIVRGTSHTNVIFDILMPYESALSDEQIRKAIRDYLDTLDNARYFAVITVDRSYV